MKKPNITRWFKEWWQSAVIAGFVLALIVATVVLPIWVVVHFIAKWW